MKSYIFISFVFLFFSVSFSKNGNDDKKYSLSLESLANPICQTDSFHVKALGNHPCKHMQYDWYHNGILVKTTKTSDFSLSKPVKGDVIYVIASCTRHRKKFRYTSLSVVIDFKECNFYENYQIMTEYNQHFSQNVINIRSSLIKKLLNIKLYNSKGQVIYAGKHYTNEVISVGKDPLLGNHFLEIEIDNVITHKLVNFE